MSRPTCGKPWRDDDPTSFRDMENSASREVSGAGSDLLEYVCGTCMPSTSLSSSSSPVTTLRVAGRASSAEAPLNDWVSPRRPSCVVMNTLLAAAAECSVAAPPAPDTLRPEAWTGPEEAASLCKAVLSLREANAESGALFETVAWNMLLSPQCR